jgi:hypothetical protein
LEIPDSPYSGISRVDKQGKEACFAATRRRKVWPRHHPHDFPNSLFRALRRIKYLAMVEDSNIWKDSRELLERIEGQALASRPREAITVETPDLLTLQMYWRCVSLFRSALILLENNHPEEALILA